MKVELFDQRDGSLQEFEISSESSISDLLNIANINPSKLKISVLARVRELDFKLKDGHRVEILRPLIADPKKLRIKRIKKS